MKYLTKIFLFLNLFVLVEFVLFVGCQQQKMDDNKLKEFATRYTAAWCSQNAASVASFFAEDGSLKINNGKPSVGREAITKDAQGFMTAFPDMIVAMDSLNIKAENVIYYWTLTGTNTGPGGTGKKVKINGYEEWTIGADGLIAESKGHFDEADYQHQIKYGLNNQQQQNADTKSGSEKIDLQKIRPIIETLDKQFSKDFYNGDSVALASYYSSDAKFGLLKGKEILSAWGRMIRNSVKDNTRNLLFTTTAFTGDSVYMVDLGIYEERDDKNNLKNKGNYLVVWKQENGQWKIYRDIGL